MAKDPFLLVSLEESESKALAQVMSNDTARKILDFLSKEESATESDISKKLKVPLSTVHYNLQALTKANLVKTEEFHYSQKGKEVLHYSLANKFIIIAPKRETNDSFLQKLKGLLPITIVSLGMAAILQLSKMYFGISTVTVNYAPEPAAMLYDAAADTGIASAKMMVQEGANATAIQAAGEAAPSLMMQTAPMAQTFPAQSVGIFSADYLALWFLAGSIFALLLMVMWSYVGSRKKK